MIEKREAEIPRRKEEITQVMEEADEEPVKKGKLCPEIKIIMKVRDHFK